MSDVAANTRACQMWRFLCEARNEKHDLDVKERLFAEAYLDEMRKASFPFFFGSGWLKMANDSASGEISRERILEEMFGTDFLKEHEVMFDNVTAYNSYVFEMAHGYYIHFSCEGTNFQFFVPNPINIEVKDPDSLMPVMFSAHWCKDSSEYGCLWKMVNEDKNSSYDWKEVCENIKRFIVRSGERPNGN